MNEVKAHSFLFLILWLVLPGSKVSAQQDWNKLQTIEDTYQKYPGRLGTLLRSLDLNYPGLEKVRAAVNRGNGATACEALLNYYREGKTASFLSREQPAVSSVADPAAELNCKEYLHCG